MEEGVDWWIIKTKDAWKYNIEIYYFIKFQLKNILKLFVIPVTFVSLLHKYIWQVTYFKAQRLELSYTYGYLSFQYICHYC